MTTANLSVGINTEKARADLNALKDFMRSQLSSMALSINEKSLEASIKLAMQGPTNGFALRINTAKLKTDLSTALNDAMSGAKVGSGSIDITQIKSDLNLLKQVTITAANDAKYGERVTKEIKDSTPAMVKASADAGKAAGAARVKAEEEEGKKVRIRYSVKEGAGVVGASLPTSYTAEQVKARAEQAKADTDARAALLKRIDLMRTEFELRKKTSAEELKAFLSSEAKAGGQTLLPKRLRQRRRNVLLLPGCLLRVRTLLLTT